jgi:outer membrane protein insertion porin family
VRAFLLAFLVVALVAAGPKATAQDGEEGEDDGVAAESSDGGEVEEDGARSRGPQPDPLPEGEGEEESESVSYVLERIRVRGNRRTANDVILNLVPLRGGETLDPSDARLEQARYQLLGTGFFATVELSIERGSAPGRVVLLVDVVERNTFFLEQIALGASRGFVDVRTGATQGDDVEPYFGITAAETNLFGAGLTLRGSVLGSGPQQGIRLSLTDPTFLGSPEGLSIVGFFNRAREFFGDDDVLVTPIGCAVGVPCEATPNAIVEYLRGGGTIGVTIPVLPTLRFAARWALEVVDVLNRPDAASELLGSEVVPIDFSIHDGTSDVSRIELGVTLDTRDDPIITRSGVLLSGQVDLAAFLIGSSYDYFRGEVSYRQWFRLPEWDHTLRISFFGAAALGDVPFFHQLYAADLSDLIPNRMLEMNLDRRGPPNLFRNSIRELRFAHLAARLDAEYSVRLFGGDPVLRSGFLYANVGVYVLAQPSFFSRPIAGYSGIDAFPWDLTFDLGLRFETPIGVFQIGFSTLLGFFSFE